MQHGLRSPAQKVYILHKKLSLSGALCAKPPQRLGIVYAPDEKSAEAKAIAEFKIGEELRRRLIVRPND